MAACNCISFSRTSSLMSVSDVSHLVQTCATSRKLIKKTYNHKHCMILLACACTSSGHTTVDYAHGLQQRNCFALIFALTCCAVTAAVAARNMALDTRQKNIQDSSRIIKIYNSTKNIHQLYVLHNSQVPFGSPTSGCVLHRLNCFLQISCSSGSQDRGT